MDPGRRGRQPLDEPAATSLAPGSQRYTRLTPQALRRIRPEHAKWDRGRGVDVARRLGRIGGRVRSRSGGGTRDQGDGRRMSRRLWAHDRGVRHQPARRVRRDAVTLREGGRQALSTGRGRDVCDCRGGAHVSGRSNRLRNPLLSGRSTLLCGQHEGMLPRGLSHCVRRRRVLPAEPPEVCGRQLFFAGVDEVVGRTALGA